MRQKKSTPDSHKSKGLPLILWPECHVPGVKRIRDPTNSQMKPCLTEFSCVKSTLTHFPYLQIIFSSHGSRESFNNSSLFVQANTFEPINLISFGSSPPLFRPPVRKVLPSILSTSTSNTITMSAMSLSTMSTMSSLSMTASPTSLVLLGLPAGTRHLKADVCPQYSNWSFYIHCKLWLARLVPDGKEVEEDRKAAIYNKCCLCVALQRPLRLHKHADIHSKSPSDD